MPTGGGGDLAKRNRALLVGAAVVAVANVLRLLSGGANAALVGLLLLVSVPVVLVPFFRADRRRRDAASASGAWGSSASVHIEQLRGVPRFARQLANVRKTAFTNGWIGGGVVLDANGVTWTPTTYSLRRRGMPILSASWTDVAVLHLARQPGIGDPAVLEVQLADGSTWGMNVRPYRELRDALSRFPVEVR